jgi:Holliday junction resolvasome RuvABC endonuclease subunit
MSVLCIDPGLHACGCALFDTRVSNNLVWAGLIKNRVDAHPDNPTRLSTLWNAMVDAVFTEMHVRGYSPDQMAIELPQVYMRTRSKGDPNDLIHLAGLVGALTHWFRGTTFTYLPHDWKGTVPKEIMEARILKRLSDDEKSKIQKAPKGLMHNVYDAVGIGLVHLKRL